MKILERLSLFRQATQRNNPSGPLAVAHWDREWIHYMVVSPKSRDIRSADVGTLSHSQHQHPFAALADHFKANNITVTRLVILLSRPELDQVNLDLPGADDGELAGLVANEVEQQLGDIDGPPVVDFYRVPGTSNPEQCQVLAFALNPKELSKLQSEANEFGWRLVAVGSRHLSPLGVLARRHVAEDLVSVSIHLYANEAELTVCLGAKPLLLRSIRINPEDPARIAEQIWLESQRCLTLLPKGTDESQLGWFLFTTNDTAWRVLPILEDRGGVTVLPIDPLIGWNTNDAQNEPAIALQTTAANAGAAWDFLHGQLPIDLLAPRQIPRSASPWKRWAALASAAVFVSALGLYFLLRDVEQLRDQVVQLEQQFGDATKLASKYQEKADQVTVVEDWLNDRVDWLSELNELSRRLPDGQTASVRRLSAATTAGRGTIDLSVQVAKPEDVAQLEHGIRGDKYSTTSKQISQNATATEYPWQFETRVSFKIVPQVDRPSIPAAKTVAQPTARPNQEDKP